MIIKLLIESEKPLYQQLKEEIIYALAKGELIQGELLPSVRQLAASLSINMHTVNKAYNQLVDESFLTMYKGKGAIVNSPSQYSANDKNVESINKNISIIASQAKCRSINKDTFIKMCNVAYDDFMKENEDDK